MLILNWHKNAYTVQSWFSDIEFSDKLWFSDYNTVFFNLLHKIIWFSDTINLVTVFADTKSVTKSRLNCISKGKLVYSVIASI